MSLGKLKKTGLCLDALGLSYGSTRILDGLNLDVPCGQVQGLLGENGAGKTTTLEMAFGLLAGDTGCVSLNGHDLSGLRPHQRANLGLGYLPQGPSVFTRLSVEDNLHLAMQESPRLRGKSIDLDALLARYGLTELTGRKAALLSGGERRRLELARTMLLEPRCVLLDEPFSGLDPLAVEQVRKDVRAMAERGVAVLLTDHNVQALLAACDRVALLWHGSILLNETPSAFRNNEEARRLYLGDLA